MPQVPAWVSTAPTGATRSGDRIRNGMLVAGFSLTGISIILDPYVSFWMGVQTQRGIHFQDPEAWKDAVIQFTVVLLTGLWGVIHMALVRRADRPADESQGPDASAYTILQRELQEADAELGRLRAQMAEAQAVRADRPLTQILSHTDLPPTV